jgi:N-methylhydantoinase A
MLLGVDTGGTFTDFFLIDGDTLRIHKVLSTPDDPSRAILEGAFAMGLEAPLAAGEVQIVHGSTVATNATLEGKGVRTVYICNRGFTDVLRIGRQARSRLYDLHPEPRPDPVPAELTLGTGGRLDPRGRVLEPLTDADLDELRRAVVDLRPEAIAINLLYSYLDDQFECRIEAALQDLAFVSRSSFVLPESKEYERGIATWLNAWLGPVVSRYLVKLTAALAPSTVAVMQSSGGTIGAAQASRRAVNLLVSGPAGGVAAATRIGADLGRRELLSFDMGGTSTDVSLLRDGPTLTDEGFVGPYPVAIPMADIHTIGAGGGSIAFLDPGGALRVGPESAGADPGPACYGQGGERPTVTDANVALGRLPANLLLGGSMPLDAGAAQRALERVAEPLGMTVEQAARGVLEIANEHMAQALRVISLERGYDPRDFALISFGGAGGLHVCALADALGIPDIIVPTYGGVLSALGLLMAPPSRIVVRTLNLAMNDVPARVVEEAIVDLARGGLSELRAEGVDTDIEQHASLDLRYTGQTFTINVPWHSIDHCLEEFHRQHEQRYGHALALPVDLVNLRVQLRAPARSIALPPLALSAERSSEKCEIVDIGKVEVLRREELSPGTRRAGPLLLIDSVSTTLVEPGWSVTSERRGHAQMTRD